MKGADGVHIYPGDSVKVVDGDEIYTFNGFSNGVNLIPRFNRKLNPGDVIKVPGHVPSGKRGIQASVDTAVNAMKDEELERSKGEDKEPSDSNQFDIDDFIKG